MEVQAIKSLNWRPLWVSNAQMESKFFFVGGFFFADPDRIGPLTGKIIFPMVFGDFPLDGQIGGLKTCHSIWRACSGAKQRGAHPKAIFLWCLSKSRWIMDPLVAKGPKLKNNWSSTISCSNRKADHDHLPPRFERWGV